MSPLILNNNHFSKVFSAHSIVNNSLNVMESVAATEPTSQFLKKFYLKSGNLNGFDIFIRMTEPVCSVFQVDERE